MSVVLVVVRVQVLVVVVQVAVVRITGIVRRSRPKVCVVANVAYLRAVSIARRQSRETSITGLTTSDLLFHAMYDYYTALKIFYNLPLCASGRPD